MRLVEVRVRQVVVAVVGLLAGLAHVALRGLLAGLGVARGDDLLIAPVAGLLAGGLFRGQLISDAPVFFVPRLSAGLRRRGG